MKRISRSKYLVPGHRDFAVYQGTTRAQTFILTHNTLQLTLNSHSGPQVSQVPSDFEAFSQGAFELEFSSPTLCMAVVEEMNSATD